MQLLTNVSKFVIVALLTSSLLIVWDTDNSINGLTATGSSTINANFTPAYISEGESTTVSAQPVAGDANSVWSSMSHEFKLDHQVQTAQVQAEIHKLLADQTKLHQILQAAAPYIYFIHQQTQAHGLPAEIALIPFIESEYNPNDHSTKGATGLWQLMSGTAHELGVNVKSGYDGRKDVIASTKAALAYFKDLGHDFNGDWYLAIAAYNCGQVKVEHEEKKTGSHSFWTLPLPRETKFYVPKLLAVAAIVQNPAKYGVQLPPVTNAPYFARVEVKKPVNLNQVAKSTGVSIQTLNTLNPDYKHGIVPKQGMYTLLVPVNKVNKVPAVEAELPTTTSLPA